MSTKNSLMFMRKTKEDRNQGHKKLLWISYKYNGGDDGKV
jgi:hypothetical protein